MKPYRDDPNSNSRNNNNDGSYHDDDDDDDNDYDYNNNNNRNPRVDMTNNQHLHQHQLLIQEQDQHLDRLAASVSRQHTLSLQIGDELDSHLELLDEMDQLTDHSQSRLATAKQRLATFSRKARDNGSMVTIAILFLIFIILLIVLK